MPAQWTADLIGEMHLHGITVMNGRREPKNAESTCKSALERMISEQKQNSKT